MLSIASMSPGQEKYYSELAREDYYLGGGEPPGRWLGEGAQALGLEGVVGKEAISNLFKGLAPDGTTSLVQQQAYRDGRTRQPGWDLTFSAPKSVSTIWSQVGQADREKIQQAHFAAVEAALGYIQEKAGRTRRGRGGESVEQAGLVIATFEHGTSRALDPQLHTHALVINAGVREDGSWGSITSRGLYRHKMAAGALYRAELANQLSKTLGLTFEQVKTWIEVRGVSDALCDVFSKRSHRIRDEMAKAGSNDPKLAERLTLITREVKGHVARVGLFDSWRAVGLRHAFSRTEAEALLQRPGQRMEPLVSRGQWIEQAVSAVEAKSTFTKDDLLRAKDEAVRSWTEACGVPPNAIDQAITALTQNQSTFTERDLVRALAEALQALAVPAIAIVERARLALANSPEILRLGEANHELTFTTRDMLRQEAKLLQAVEQSRGDNSHTVAAEDAFAAAGKRPTLTEEQRLALEHLTIWSGSIQCLEGLAGTGKSFLLGAAREVWEGAGYQVRGIALAGKAASELESGAGIRSQTMASFLMEQAAGQHALGKHSVLVLDEAGMVGTRQMLEVVEVAKQAGAKLVVVGDPLQLQPIEAGGAFPAIVRALGSAKLTNIVRQFEEWMVDAIRQVVEGDVRGALTQYALAERLEVADDKRGAMACLVQDWFDRRRTTDLRESLVLVSTNEDAGKLNQSIQNGRLVRGELDVEASTKLDETKFYVGDRVLFERNHKSLGVRNGYLGTIESISQQDGEPVFTVLLDHANQRGEKRVTFSGHEYEDLSLGYALTTHKAQGVTVNEAFVLLSDGMLDREMFYVQLSRARETTRLYTDSITAGDDLEVLTKTLSRSRQKHLAHDFVPEGDRDHARYADQREPEDDIPPPPPPAHDPPEHNLEMPL